MTPKPGRSNFYFWLLVVVCFSLLSLVLAVSWTYGQAWVQTLGHLCRLEFQELLAHLPPAWQVITPTILIIMMMLGGLSTVQQTRATLHLRSLFLPLRESPPTRVKALLAAQDLQPDDLIFLDLKVAHAFCLGFWRPQIWLTAGMVNLLTDDELAAVLAHEAHHCRQRDPLRLLIGRVLKPTFFFLPLVGDLAKMAELHQEVAADQAAIAYLGSDLPLLCTLQKLLKHGGAGTALPVAAYSPFHVTEARIQRLLYPPTPFSWRPYLSNILINSGILLIFSSLALLPAQFTSGETNHCVTEPIASLQAHPHLPSDPM